MRNLSTLVIFLIVAVVVLVIPGLALWTGRNLDFWLTYFKGHEVHIPYWIDLLLTFFGNGFIVFLNIVGEVGRFLIK